LKKKIISKRIGKYSNKKNMWIEIIASFIVLIFSSELFKQYFKDNTFFVFKRNTTQIPAIYPSTEYLMKRFEYVLNPLYRDKLPEFENFIQTYFQNEQWKELLNNYERPLSEVWQRMRTLVPTLTEQQYDNGEGFKVQVLTPEAKIIGDNIVESYDPLNLTFVDEFPEVKLALTHGTYILRRCKKVAGKDIFELFAAFTWENDFGTPVMTRFSKLYEMQ